jgi:sterol desaturase/sphingolipid hydroxylase (fatty acid hydroxylase superfamily)
LTFYIYMFCHSFLRFVTHFFVLSLISSFCHSFLRFVTHFFKSTITLYPRLHSIHDYTLSTITHNTITLYPR